MLELEPEFLESVGNGFVLRGKLRLWDEEDEAECDGLLWSFDEGWGWGWLGSIFGYGTR